jgi:hypothetical protein
MKHNFALVIQHSLYSVCCRLSCYFPAFVTQIAVALKRISKAAAIKRIDEAVS